LAGRASGHRRPLDAHRRRRQLGRSCPRRRPGPKAGRHQHRRREFDGNLLIEASHDGYRKPFGLIHRRAVFLAADGEDVRGEDELNGPGGRTFAIRFHLHPRIQASLLAEGAGVLLRTAAGHGWKFRAEGGAVSLEDSVYLGDGTPRRTRQIMVAGSLDGQGVLVKWRLNRA